MFLKFNLKEKHEAYGIELCSLNLQFLKSINNYNNNECLFHLSDDSIQK